MPNTVEIPVFLVPPDDSWPDQFLTEAALIESLFQPKLMVIEHIGSKVS